jgi:hypothetical protein
MENSRRVGIYSLQRVYTYVAVEFKLSDISDGEVFFGPDLGCVKGVEVKIIGLAFGDRLDTEVPFRVLTTLNCGPKILAMEVGILSSQLQGFIPHETVHTKVRCEVELDKIRFSLRVE